jgi:hypothetical protein
MKLQGLNAMGRFGLLVGRGRPETEGVEQGLTRINIHTIHH